MTDIIIAFVCVFMAWATSDKEIKANRRHKTRL